MMDIKGDKAAVIFEDVDSIKFVNNGLSIHNNGKNNHIYIGKNIVFNNFNIRVDANDCIISLGDMCRLTGTVIMKLINGNQLTIGDRTSIEGANFICGEGRKIEIGKNCMIAWGIEFRTTDSHGIFDLSTNERLNKGGDIIIEDDVWVGAHASILKGALIKSGSVVSIKSLVTSKFADTNIVIGGIPAKVLKRNIYWKRALLG